MISLTMLAAQAAAAGERVLNLTPGTDYYGHDYATVKEVDLEACQRACLEDTRCLAFTFNLKAGWCFLKESFADPRPFAGAISGRIGAASGTAGVAESDDGSAGAVGGAPGATGAEAAAARRTAEAAARAAERAANRAVELRFLPPAELGAARALAERIARMPPPVAGRAALELEARQALGANDLPRMVDRLTAALRAAADEPGADAYGLWMELVTALLAARPDDWTTRQRFRRDATAAAIQAYLHADRVPDRATALALLGRAFQGREQWREAIRATRAALALAEDPALRDRYDRLVAEHGFRIAEHEVESDTASPRLCLNFSEPLARERANLADFVKVEGRPDLPVEVEARRICIEGFEHGQRYRLQVRAGLPSADGETLARAAELEIYVRDRAPLVRFLGRAYVLPKGGEAAIPVVSVNTRSIQARVHRIGDRALARAVTEGTFRGQLDRWDTERIADSTGEQVWEGTVEVREELNREVTTAVPVGALVPELKPGVYALTARPGNAESSWDAQPTQWFVVSDLGLATLSGNDGLHVMVRSLASARPIGAVTLRLVAVNAEILGEATADAEGYARFAPGLLRGTGGNAPALLTAEGPDGDYGFLDLTQSPFDLSDRGVTGRPAPQPLDVYLVSERGAYRPGESVHLTALARNPRAEAVPDLPLTLILRRPDGVEHSRVQAQDQGLGSYRVVFETGRAAMRGTWRAALHSDPKAPALAEIAFLVEDFEPERLTFELQSPVPTLDPADPPRLALDGRFLYGAPAADLRVEGELRLKPTDRLPDFPGYRFGLASESVEPVGQPLPPTRTDAAGQASLVLEVPELAPTSRPLEAELQVRLLESGGRPVERTLTLPVAGRQARIGIRPLFEGAVDEGGTARFEVLAVGADGRPMALAGLRWTLSRLTTSFQWYGTDGQWNYEPLVSTRRVADGTLGSVADGPVRIEAPVEWGAYRLAIQTPDGAALPTDLDFDAGWYVAPTAVDTPDLLRVSLDRPAYRVGETARVRLEPRVPGLALLTVIDDRLIAMRAVQVPAEGTTVELPVTADWGPGAYVAATLYRPMDLAARRMPARALGLSWAGVDPAERRLMPRLELDPAQPIRPRQRLEIPVSVAPDGAGQPVYVTVAAVDLGILNLTRHAPHDPDGWYFGQRRLGMELRDLYGQLIDRMQGEPGQVRSGGDGGAMRLEGAPPTETLAAFQSGIQRLDGQGRATVAFDLPDFNGTLRVMVMVWSAHGVGHATQDLLVRDPVVALPSFPRVLAPGDRSRLLLELTPVEGPAGAASLSLSGEGMAANAGAGTAGTAATADGTVIRIPPEFASQEVRLTEGERTRLEIPLEAAAIGDATLHLTLRTPSGPTLTKTLRLSVRDSSPPVVRGETVVIPPGEERRWDAGALDGLVPGTGRLLASVSGAGRLDVAGLLLALDRYPHGCTEQLVSRALPLLYLDEVALAAGLTADPPGIGAGADTGAPTDAPNVRERVRAAIGAILANQSSGGGFGVWNAQGDDGDTWLAAYATDFLTRARELGYQVPDPAFDSAIDNLRNRLSYASDFEHGGEDIAHALHALARNGRAAIGDLRYYVDNRLERFATPLARAQLGAALALYGDPERAATAFRSALTLLEATPETDGWRADYGSRLRDGAALLALAAENGSAALDTAALASRLQAWSSAAARTSTQEQAWLLLAAHALMRGADRPRLAVNGEPLDGPLFRRLDADTLAALPLRLRNLGKRPLEAMVTVAGIPREPPPAGGAGYRIERAWYDLEGRRVQPSAGIAQGERLIAVLTVTADQARQARLLVEDPLPAGFEIENPHLLRSGELAGLPWLDPQSEAAHVEFRAGRFVAALDRAEGAPARVQLAYRLRAVSPGVFVQPAASVEDMYRPQLRAWTETGRAEIRAH